MKDPTDAGFVPKPLPTNRIYEPTLKPTPTQNLLSADIAGKHSHSNPISTNTKKPPVITKRQTIWVADPFLIIFVFTIRLFSLWSSLGLFLIQSNSQTILVHYQNVLIRSNHESWILNLQSFFNNFHLVMFFLKSKIFNWDQGIPKNATITVHFTKKAILQPFLIIMWNN